MNSENEKKTIEEMKELQLKRAKMIKSLLIHGTIIVILIILSIIGIVGKLYSEHFREFTKIVTFILSSFVTYYIIFVKEFQIKDDFKHLPRKIKVVWFPMFIFNAFNSVNNGFILFLDKSVF
jgi:hypothetical protein